MRQISLDDVGQVMPDSYWGLFGGKSPVYPAMVIQAPSGRKLAITFPVDSKRSGISGRHRRAIHFFMKETRK